MAAMRPSDHASLVEATRTRLAVSRRLCLSTATLIEETRVTIERTLEKLEVRLDVDAARNKDQ
jgi:hypothetical protein